MMMREPVVVNGVTRWLKAGETMNQQNEAKEPTMPVLREEIGYVLRDVRQRQGRTLREVSHDARVSLGYLSEVERGQKEASSELLSAITAALDIPLSVMLREVSDRIAVEEAVQIPDTIPAELAHRYAKQQQQGHGYNRGDHLAKR
mgnify:CR=1 FL=1